MRSFSLAPVTLYPGDGAASTIWRITSISIQSFSIASGTFKVLLLIQFSFARFILNTCQEAHTVVWNTLGRYFRRKRISKRAFVLMTVIIITAS